MRRKILTGFLVIAFLLLFSVVVTMYQLQRLGNTTKVLIDRSSADIELSKSMLDAVQEQNTALMDKIVSGGSAPDSMMAAAGERFAGALGLISDNHVLIDSVAAAKVRYDRAVSGFDPGRGVDANLEWFVGVYRTEYRAVTGHIKGYIVAVDKHLNEQADELGSRAYRVITPSVLTLIVLIMVIGMFFLFVDLYFVRPVARIDRALGRYLKFNMPFDIKVEGRDEVHSLREKIDELTTICRGLKNK